MALYHGFEDWIRIPEYMDRLGLGYRLTLWHFTVHAEETILFAWVDPPRRRP